MDWTETLKELPPEHVVVETKIDVKRDAVARQSCTDIEIYGFYLMAVCMSTIGRRIGGIWSRIWR